MTLPIEADSKGTLLRGSASGAGERGGKRGQHDNESSIQEQVCAHGEARGSSQTDKLTRERDRQRERVRRSKRQSRAEQSRGEQRSVDDDTSFQSRCDLGCNHNQFISRVVSNGNTISQRRWYHRHIPLSPQSSHEKSEPM